MIFSDQRIIEALEEQIDIFPWRPKQLNPASYDLTLAPGLLVPEFSPVLSRRNQAVHLQPLNLTDVSKQPPYLQPHQMGLGTPYVIEPGEFLLACTVERVGLATSVAARVEGKSSLARVGLAVHVTGGFIDPGFNGQITLEIVNLLHRPLMLFAGMRIAQIAFMPVNGPVIKSYTQTGHYQNQAGPTPSRYKIES